MQKMLFVGQFMHPVWADRHASTATDALLLHVLKLGLFLLGLGVVAPRASQGTALEKHRCADPWAVVHAKPLDLGYGKSKFNAHFVQSPYPAILYSR